MLEIFDAMSLHCSVGFWLRTSLIHTFIVLVITTEQKKTDCNAIMLYDNSCQTEALWQSAKPALRGNRITSQNFTTHSHMLRSHKNGATLLLEIVAMLEKKVLYRSLQNGFSS